MKLKELRKAKGVTQLELAEAIGITTRIVVRWESGKVDMHLMTALKVAKFLGTTLDNLIRN
ncbi:helix-turn-helix transcriptional regulator [Streptococcus pyogenes]|uniref:helix-turn-helix transcriptional regulator n=1 Tax=Streptococcus pyogenes TaxID=1314 RepID=UPI0010A12A5D|nr:helix-turn-helix transcriptional regulator [Streptococcus pyogenes]VGV41972.1 putative transcriptional regulator [Streptococcus pyogenes]VGV60920.1 putative transcriptional regulator [Streptococcus pyogenes]VGW10488.1 putative transcriptional regulator [Streptococcus pyogenes]VHC07939.1 putative transcriptional regulator [Streptococcus pyogenes]VHC60607.1 putative transcriptional regulator [Streptococcus pyogenes]